VRVIFVRGVRRVVGRRVSPSSSPAVVSGVDVSLPDVSLPDVSVVDVGAPGLISEVTGGLVLVMVWVVVGVDVGADVAEYDGST
jgi:hypothetical protein